VIKVADDFEDEEAIDEGEDEGPPKPAITKVPDHVRNDDNEGNHKEDVLDDDPN